MAALLTCERVDEDLVLVDGAVLGVERRVVRLERRLLSLVLVFAVRILAVRLQQRNRVSTRMRTRGKRTQAHTLQSHRKLKR